MGNCASPSVKPNMRFRGSEWESTKLADPSLIPCEVSSWCLQIIDSSQSQLRSTGTKSPVCSRCKSNSTVPGPKLELGEVHPPPSSSVPELSTHP